MSFIIAVCVGFSPNVVLLAHADQPNEHGVRRGESVWLIAQRYGVSVHDIVELNHLENPSLIHAGVPLVLSGASNAPDVPAVAPVEASLVEVVEAPSLTTQQATEHVVQRGEHVWRIAQQYGVSSAAIVQLNELENPRLVHAGLRLRVPQANGGTRIDSRNEAITLALDSPPTTANALFGGGVLGSEVYSNGVAADEALSAPSLDTQNEVAEAASGPLQNGQNVIETSVAAAPPVVLGAAEEVAAMREEWLPQSYRTTFYCLQGRMGNGRFVHEGAVAADASIFPYGTMLEIEGLGTYTVQDRFGWDAGQPRLDVWVPDCNHAIRMGVKTLRVRLMSAK